MTIAQVCLRLATIKGHSKMCSFTVWGRGPKTSQYLVWPPFASCSATHYLLSCSGCWLWPVECWSTPLQWMCEVAGYWQELEHAVVYADPEHPKHAQWVTCPVSMLAMQELGCFQLPGIVYRSLQHGAMHYHAFIVASLRHTCALIMLSNQHLDMPHLWGGWIISAKEKCSLTQI